MTTESEQLKLPEPRLLTTQSRDGLISSWSPRKLSPLIMPGAEMAPRSPGRRKISESRGVALPEIELRYRGTHASPPPSASPVGHYMNKAHLNRSPKFSERSRAIMEICIFMPDQRGIHFKVEGGRVATVEQLNLLVWNHLNLKPSFASELFTLWMCSPLLEVQLKPHHVALEVRKYWPDLLKRFTLASDEERDFDEPILVIKRNVLLRKERQLVIQEIAGEKALDLLFLEARQSILSGRYLCPLDTCMQLTAINMVMEWGPYNNHSVDFIRESIDEMIPSAHLSSVRTTSLFGWHIPGCKGMENEILTSYQEMSTKSTEVLKTTYLSICMQLPTYGCASFSGQIERPGHILFKDLPVQVLVSRDYVCVVDTSKYTSLLTVASRDCSWRKHGNSEPECLPSFFLHFLNSTSTGSSSSSKLLQIFSKQSVMIDALMNSCAEASLAEDEVNADWVTDDKKMDNEIALMAQSPIYHTKLNRMCLGTFDADGKCLEAAGSLKLILDVEK